MTQTSVDVQQQPSGTQTEGAGVSVLPELPVERGSARKPGEEESTSVSNLDRWLARRLLAATGRLPIAIELWDGEQLTVSDESPRFRLRIADRAALWLLAFDPDLQFGELYSDGRLEVEGGLLEFLETVDRALPLSHSNWLSTFIRRARRWLRHNTLARSKANVHHHYDLGNDFYKLWLDEQMLYTCAYFPRPDCSLEEAQVAKMDHVCRKVRLKPGDLVVEAGCGWGALALHMARHYGVKVKAYNISHEQIVYARERARAEGLDDRVEFIEDDWRNIRGTYDAFVSVGMLEHVGPENYRLLGDVIHNCLKPEGLALLHSIGRNVAYPLNAWVDRRIFPGAHPPSLRQIMDILEGWQFSVLDIENLRLHYAKTLEHWLARFEDHVEFIRDMFDDRFIRMWRLYLAASVASFRTGGLQLFQVVFTHPLNNNIPWTREHLYRD
ncbi:MAG: class I SAM-dependent methyltransferase [Planctomycetes bacterium]|nr:class I SAM-dependent methyltransferase [Planctomycetota bacterium]